ncbi:outer membrane beta-barrel protein [Sphingosinicellaceae bacterium]|nr:outer membrane beta-barrel protein [Sphingosinicellaceae bacterium]
MRGMPRGGTFAPSLAALASALLTSAVLTSTASAQVLPPDDTLVNFRRFTAVRERRIEGYDAVGVPVGSFTLSPSINATAQYTDNIFAAKDDKVGDALARIEPSALLQSNWSQRSLTLSANGRLDRYADHSSENVSAINASAYGVQQFGDSTRLRLIGRYVNDRESREAQTAFALTQRPVNYQTMEGALGLSQRFAQFLVNGEAGYTRYQYQDARLMDGTPLDESFRNQDTFRLRVRAEIAQSPSLAYFVEASRVSTSYDARDTNSGNARGSTTYQVLGGSRFELPFGARGEIGLGYVNGEFKGAQYRNFSGLAISSKVLLFPSDLTTVTVAARRSVSDAGTLNSTGYIATVGSVQVDHELLRNLILGAGIQYEHDTFNGVDRRDGRFGASASAEYRLNRSLSVRADYDFIDLSSRGAESYRSFSRNRASIGIRYRV